MIGFSIAHAFPALVMHSGVVLAVIDAASALAAIEDEADFEWQVEPISWPDVCDALADVIGQKSATEENYAPVDGWDCFIRNLLR